MYCGEMLVRCVSGCLPLFEVVVPPPDSEDPLGLERDLMEPEGGGRVVPYEGSDPKESSDDELPF